MSVARIFFFYFLVFSLCFQVESIPLSASFLISKAIREVAYGLLLGQKQQQSHSSQRTLQADQVSAQLKSHSGPSQDIDSEFDRGERTNLQPDTGSEDVSPLKQDVLLLSPVEYTENDTETSESSTSAAGTKESETGIVEYTRHNLELWRVAVQPRDSLSKFGSIPSLECIPALSQHDRQAILLETLGVTADFVGKFEPNIQLYMVCLVFWVRKAAPSVTFHHLRGVVLSAVLLHVHKEIANRENRLINKCMRENITETSDIQFCSSGSQNQTRTDCKASKVTCEVDQVSLPKAHRESGMQSAVSPDTECEGSSILSITRVLHSADDKVLAKVQDNLKKYYHNPAKISSKNLPEHETFHRSAQFQACFLDAVHLNSLLRCPLKTPHPAVLFNGSFIYTIIHELQVRSNPDLFLSEMLVKGSALAALFESLCSQVIQEAGEGVLEQRSSQGKKCCKSAKRKKKNKASASESRGGSDRVSLEGGQSGETVMASCDLSNRFGLLSVDEGS